MGVSTMGLLYQLETELERELPGRLRQSLQRALDAYQAQCPACGLVMHRHHAYRRSIMTGYGAVELQIPVFPVRRLPAPEQRGRRVGRRGALPSGIQKNRRVSPENWRRWG